MSEIILLEFLNKLQSPIPQYVLGSLPAIAAIGTTPQTTLIAKVIWMLRCFSCPFTGMLYFCNIGRDPVAMGAYWLSSKHFVYYYEPSEVENQQDENQQDENHVMIDGKRYIRAKNNIYKPFGYHAKKLYTENNINSDVVDILENCVAKASLLDRSSSFVSACFIVVGVLAGIYKVAGPCVRDRSYQDWPYIPLALIWTLPASIKIACGTVVDRWPVKMLDGVKIIVIDYQPDEINAKRRYFFLTALVSITLPWIVVIIAYFTRPIGFFCRSKYLTVMCSIWSFNSILAITFHIKGEKRISGYRYINAWFCICGAIMIVLLVLLSLLANTNPWWVSLFGSSCDVSCI